MRKPLSIILISVLLILSFFVISCDEKIEEPNTPDQVVYNTPTLKGAINLSKNTGLLAEDFWVKVTDGNDTKSITEVKADGSFVVSGLEVGVKYSVLITSVTPDHTNYSKGLTDEEGYGGWLTSVSASIEGTDVGSVKVKPLGTIKGVAKLQDQEEFYDITVYIPGTSFIAMTDKDGNFSISNVPEGAYQLRYTISGYASIMSDTFYLTSGGDESKHPVLIRPEVTLVSNVATVEGYAFRDGVTDNSGISIKLEKEDKTASYASLTSENGFFQVLGVQPGNYRILASYSGYPTQTSDLFKVEEGSTTVLGEQISLFENIGTISGSVSLDNSEIKGGITILFTNLVTAETYTTVSDENGNFQKNLKPGSYRLTASYVGYTSQILNVDVFQGSNVTVQIPSLLNANGGFAGKVVLLGSINDSSGVIVSYVHASDPSIKGTTVTDADGSYLVTNLSKGGQYYLTFTKDGFLKDQSHVVAVTKGSINEVEEVELRNLTSTVKGTIQLEGTNDYTGINVLLKAQSGELQFSSSTDDKGGYTISSVIPGKYKLYASKDGYQTKIVEDVVVETATKKTLDTVVLSIGVRSISGKVNLELRSDHSGALITATNTKEPTLIYSAITNSSGNFALAGMKPGEYNIVISSSNYRTMTLPTIDVIANTTETLNTVNLEIARGYITGYVKLDGRTEFDGIKVDLVGTGYSTKTNKEGIYSFYVPSGNYPGGVSFSKEDFEVDADTNTITVLTDSTYAVTEKYTLKATAIPLIKGQVDVRGTDDDSNVSVSIKGTNYRFTTSENGYFEFVHIPAYQDYVLVVERENATTIEKAFSTTPAKEIDLGKITLTPHSSSIEGTVTLHGQNSFEGIKIKVESEGERVLETVTDLSGYFYIGGLLSTAKHSIIISKDGWDSVVRVIDDLEPLEVRDITYNNSVELIDTTAPVINSVTINNGSTATSNAIVNIEINATDVGSGIELMRTTWLDDFESSSWVPYTKNFDSIISIVNNEQKTIKIQVKDAAGNISEVKSDDIALVGQVNTMFGSLTQEHELHWVNVGNTPYVITGDIIINPGYRLVIDPGVQVYFAGDYGISVRGTIYAVGTEEEPIRFEPVKDNVEGQSYYGPWKGISLVDTENKYNVINNKYKFTYVDGCTLQYCIIDGLTDGLGGKAYVANCEITAKERVTINERGSLQTSYSALKNCYGVITKSKVIGNISVEYSDVDVLYFNNELVGSQGIETECVFGSDCSLVNNLIKDYDIVRFGYNDSIVSNDFLNDMILIYDWNVKFLCNQLIGETKIEVGPYADSLIFKYNNNYSACVPVLQINADYNKIFNFTNNYWGSTNTIELQNIDNGVGKYPSFIMDGRVPGNMDKAIVNYQPYVTEPWSFAGYKGDEYVAISTEFSWNGREPIYGEPVGFRIKEGAGEIDEYRIAQTVEDLLSSEWKPLAGLAEIELLDQYVSADGFAEVYIQGRSKECFETGIESVSFCYDRPRIVECSILNDQVFKKYEDIYVAIKAYDSNYGYYCDWYLDNKEIEKYLYGENPSLLNIGSIPYDALCNGVHQIKLILRDFTGNESEPFIVSFVIDRLLPTVTGCSVVNGISIGLNEDFPVSFTVNNASHVKKILIKSGAHILSEQSYEDNTENKKTIETVVESVYLPAGENNLIVEIVDYAGDVVSSEPIMFTVNGESVAPLITVEGIEDGMEYSDVSSPTLIVNTFDEGGVKNIWVSMNDEVFESYKFTKFSSSTRERTEEFVLPLGFRKNGDYLITIFAEDFAGNVSTVERLVTVNRELPKITCFNIVNVSDEVYRLEWNCSTNNNIQRTLIYVNGSEYKYFNYQVSSVNINNLPNGDNDIQIMVQDNFGNKVYSEVKTISISKDHVASDFGLNVTWNERGNLIADPYTAMLWTFDSLTPEEEEVEQQLIGTIKENGNGIGNASNFNIRQEIDFYSPRWTLEFWTKGDTGINFVSLISTHQYYQYKYRYFSFYHRNNNIDSQSDSYIYYSDFNNVWNYFSVVSNGSGICIYRNGLLYIQVDNIQVAKLAQSLEIRCGDNSFVDEIRLSTKARSLDEIWQYYKFARDKIQN